MEKIQKVHPQKKIEVWFEDEARFGQKGTLTRVWALKGSRPLAVQQTEYGHLYVLAGACPETGEAEGMFFSSLNTDVVNEFLKQLSESISPEKHLILVLDRAGYHVSKRLTVPDNISLLHLPPYSPELNPIENLWHYLRSHYWSNRRYSDLEELEKAAQDAWEIVCLDKKKIQTICRAQYVEKTGS